MHPHPFRFPQHAHQGRPLLLAFDALILSQVLGRDASLGKLIHGDDHATLKVKTSALAGEVRKRLEKIATLLSKRTSKLRETIGGAWEAHLFPASFSN